MPTRAQLFALPCHHPFSGGVIGGSDSFPEPFHEPIPVLYQGLGHRLRGSGAPCVPNLPCHRFGPGLVRLRRNPVVTDPSHLRRTCRSIKARDLESAWRAWDYVVRQCVLCETILIGEALSREHVIPASVGGRKRTSMALCRQCNSTTGHAWDAELERQLRPPPGSGPFRKSGGSSRKDSFLPSGRKNSSVRSSLKKRPPALSSRRMEALAGLRRGAQC